MLCRKPILLNHLKDKTSHTSSLYYDYLNYLSEQGMLIIKQEKRNREIYITEKGRSFLKLWIEINSILGVKIDANIY